MRVLPGNVWRMLVELTCVLEAGPVKLEIKRREPGILFISLHVGSPYDVIIDFSVYSTSMTTSFKKCNVMTN